jgi:hypothetical protein
MGSLGDGIPFPIPRSVLALLAPLAGADVQYQRPRGVSHQLLGGDAQGDWTSSGVHRHVWQYEREGSDATGVLP